MTTIVVNRQRKERVDLDALRLFGDQLIATQPADQESSEWTIALFSDRRIAEMNRQFRGKSGATDVLSFPADENDDELGEIAISAETARRQADAAGRPLLEEIKILTLHGYLHLLGYDHETDDGTMMRLQAKLERRLGLEPMHV